MNDTSVLNRESGSTQNREEDQRLLAFPQNAQIGCQTPASPVSYVMPGNFGDTSPPGTYYTTIHSTSSRRYDPNDDSSHFCQLLFNPAMEWIATNVCNFMMEINFFSSFYFVLHFCSHALFMAGSSKWSVTRFRIRNWNTLIIDHFFEKSTFLIDVLRKTVIFVNKHDCIRRNIKYFDNIYQQQSMKTS